MEPPPSKKPNINLATLRPFDGIYISAHLRAFRSITVESQDVASRAFLLLVANSAFASLVPHATRHTI